jgi:hypothetical protein
MNSDILPLYISEKVKAKLAEKHGVTPEEVTQCFENLDGGFLRDTREEHQTDPPTYWFISETNKRRKLKIAFVHREFTDEAGKATKRTDIRTAYEHNVEELEIYERLGK